MHETMVRAVPTPSGEAIEMYCTGCPWTKAFLDNPVLFNDVVTGYTEHTLTIMGE